MICLLSVSFPVSQNVNSTRADIFLSFVCCHIQNLELCLVWRKCFSSVCFSCSFASDSLWPPGLQHTMLPCPSPTPGACSNSCTLRWWCHPTISSSVVLISSCLQSFPASESFPMSQLLASGDQSIEISAWASVLPMNIQDWFPLGLTGLISLQSKGLFFFFFHFFFFN